MEKLFLICNAHLDPVWQWRWDEGASAAISTFRVAADFCEENAGFVFSHNEALLYQWVEEYDPDLFARIQVLARAGQWKIMGGWFLQPDCNMPSGESMLRQVIAGRHYFYEKFGALPTTAMSFDAFGHTRGLVQILRRCGYDSYLFMRPEARFHPLPARNFIWRGFDGSQLLARRLDSPYNSLLGQAGQKLKDWLETEKDERISLMTWGIGNHGGGPSAVDLRAIDECIRAEKQVEIRHAVPEDFFAALKASGQSWPVVDEDLQPYNVGCYTSQIRIKQTHRRLENELYRAEKMCAAACAAGLMAYPAQELADARRDLLFGEFHDILPGSQVQPAEDDALELLHHGCEAVSRVRTRAFFALLSGEPRGAQGEIPIFIYNPHPYEVTGDFSCEFMLADQNWNEETVDVQVMQGDAACPTQVEKEDSNISLEWRKRVTFHATLPASAMSRFRCELSIGPKKPERAQNEDGAPVEIQTERLRVVINAQTGLVDACELDGQPMLRPGALAAVIFADKPDPWRMDTVRMGDTECGRFELMTPEAGSAFSGVTQRLLPSVRIIEEGAVRVVVEAVFAWGHSFLLRQYSIPRQGTALEITQRVYWNERDKLLKLEVPTTIEGGAYLGQSMFGSYEMPQDGRECVSQKWCGLFAKETALTCINDGIYGSHALGSVMYLTLLRSSAYCAHPIDGRQIIPQDRWLPRMEQGERRFRLRLVFGPAQALREEMDVEAQIFAEAPFALNAFPGGSGSRPLPLLRLSDRRIQLSALYYDAQADGFVLRLFNGTPAAQSVRAELPALGIAAELEIGAACFETYLARRGEALRQVEPVFLKPVKEADPQ